MRFPLVTLSLIAILAPPAAGQETLREVSWAALKEQGLLAAGEVLAADDQTPFDHLKIENTAASPKTVTVLDIPDPGISASRYALRGQVRYENVVGDGYLELWNHFPDYGPFFSRTVGDRGPMRVLRGSCDWREFVLPFYITGDRDTSPTRLVLNVVLPGKGTVYLGPLRLVQYDGAADPMTAAGAWWSDRTAGWLGGIGGSLLGVLGGVIGLLGGRGKARRLVVALLGVMLVVGVTSLIAGLIALLCSQPYGVYYPLVLLGILCTVLPTVMLATVRRRYEQAELRRMNAMDV